MFNTYAHTAIESIQGTKKQFVTTFVKHEGISKILNDFVDAQTKYTKAAFDAGYDVASRMGAVVISPQFANESKDAFVDATSYFVPEWLKPTTKAKK